MIFVYTGVGLGLCGGVTPVPLPSFLSLMKEKKAKENQGDDRRLFFLGTSMDGLKFFCLGRVTLHRLCFFITRGEVATLRHYIRFKILL